MFINEAGSLATDTSVFLTMVTWTTRLRRIDRVFCLIIAVSYTCTGPVATMNSCKHQITKLNTQVFAGGILYQPIGTKFYKSLNCNRICLLFTTRNIKPFQWRSDLWLVVMQKQNWISIGSLICKRQVFLLSWAQNKARRSGVTPSGWKTTCGFQPGTVKHRVKTFVQWHGWRLTN